MKYQIDTIPVLKAFEKKDECPLCLLNEKAESDEIRYYLGHSVMVPEVRIKLNESGFCGSHFSKLWKAEDSRLGLALVTHTHILKTLEKIEKELSPGRMKSKKLAEHSRKCGEMLAEKEKNCPICSSITRTLLRYAATVSWLWENEDEFPHILKNSKGFCLPHYSMILKTAPEMVPRQRFHELYRELHDLQIQNLRILADDLEWYTKKFDTVNINAPWGNSKDALPRGIQKMAGRRQKI